MAQSLRSDELEYIKAHYQTQSNRELAASLGVSKRDVHRALKQLGLQRNKGHVWQKKGSEGHLGPESAGPKRKFPRAFYLVAILLIGIAVCSVYANTLTNEFVWDDIFLIKENPMIRGITWESLTQLFKTLLFQGSGKWSMSYRPLQSLTYSLDYSLFRLNPAGYHLSSFVLHALCSVLLFISLSRILGNALLAFPPALLFGLHPIHTEAVTYIAGRADPLMGVFFLAGLYCFVGFRRSQSRWGTLWLAGLGLSYLLAVFSKEYGVFLVAVMVLYDIYFKEHGTWLRKGAPYALSGSIAAFYGWVRWTVLESSADWSRVLAEAPPLGDRILTFFKILVEYMRLLFLPFDLYMERGLPFSKTLADPYVIGALAILSVMLWILFKTRVRHPYFSFGLAWFFVMILPLSDTFYPLNASMAEHWLYIPSIGFIAAFGVWGAKAWGLDRSLSTGMYFRRFVLSPLMIIAILFAGRTVLRNSDWKDEITIWQKTANDSNSSHVHGNLAVAYYERGQVAQAVESLRHALQIQPSYPEAHYNLGYIYEERGNFKGAAQEYKAALKFYPEYQNARDGLSRVNQELSR